MLKIMNKMIKLINEIYKKPQLSKNQAKMQLLVDLQESAEAVEPTQ
jgi:hypothetical protein